MRSIAEFESWLESVAICPDYSLVEFRVEGDSWGVFAKENIPEDATLGHIPLSSVLNAETTEISHILHQEEIGGNLALVIAAAYERSLKERSKWFFFPTDYSSRNHHLSSLGAGSVISKACLSGKIFPFSGLMRSWRLSMTPVSRHASVNKSHISHSPPQSK